MATQINGSVGSYENRAKNQMPDIKTVQLLLAQAAAKTKVPQFDPGKPDGKIARVGSNSATVRAITAFQKDRVRMVRPDQRIDVGGKTWQHLVQTSGGVATPPRPAASASAFANALVRIAEGEVGVMEASRNNTGADLQKYKEATWLAPGAWAWCAAFVCWCYKEALAQNPVQGVRRPQTAAAWGFEKWADKQSGVTLFKPATSIKKGDIVMFTFSHIGIAIADEQGGSVQTVEGNTNVKGERDGGGRTRDGVYRKTRAKSLIRSVARTG